MASPSMKAIDPGDLSPQDVYGLMVATIVPRPIALVSTVSETGVPNVSPFSFFNGVASRPPIVMLSIARGSSGEKDTMRNIRATREFVVNVVDRALAPAAVATSVDYPPEVDEFEPAGLTPIPSDKVGPPRVAESPVHFECVAIDLVNEPGGASVTLVLGRVLRFHVARRLWKDGAIEPAELAPIARLGADLYAELGEPFALKRPKLPRS